MRLIIPAALILAALATGASAQVSGATAGIVAAGAEGLGQGLGAGITGTASVFVTATGNASLPISSGDTYLATIEGKAPTAMEAARLRDQRLEAARAIAQRFHAGVEVDASGIWRETAKVAPPRPAGSGPPSGGGAAKPAIPPAADEVGRDFIARTTVRFAPSDSRQDPALLDALDAAGIVGASAPSPSQGADDAATDMAGQKAIAEARRQATVLASAAGRQVGEAQRILLLLKNTKGAEATVTVAVRFALTPVK
jgi:hypothetical protein